MNLERAVERILKQYAALQSYFPSEDAPATGGSSEWGGKKRFFRLKNVFKNPLTEIYLMFFSSFLPTLTTTILLSQREDPCIHLIHHAFNRFIKHSEGMFMLVCTIKSSDHLSTINLENHKHPEDMYLGLLTKSTLIKLLEDETISDSQKENFLAGVQPFYKGPLRYDMEKLPIDDPVLKDAVNYWLISRTHKLLKMIF